MPDGMHDFSQFDTRKAASAAHHQISESGSPATALNLYRVAGQSLSFTESFHQAVDYSIEADSKQFVLLRLAEYWRLIHSFAANGLLSNDAVEQLHAGLSNGTMADCKLWCQEAINESLNALSMRLKNRLTESLSAAGSVTSLLPRAMDFLWYALSVEMANNHLTGDRDQLVLKYVSADYFTHVFLDIERYSPLVQSYLLRSLSYLLRRGACVDSLLVSDYFDGNCTSFTIEDCRNVTAFVQDLREVAGEDIVASDAVGDLLGRLKTPELEDFCEALLDVVHVDMDDLSTCDDSLNDFMNSVYDLHQKILIGNRYNVLDATLPKTESIADFLALPWPVDEAPELCERVRALLSFSELLPSEHPAMKRMDDADFRFGVVISPFEDFDEEQLHNEVYEMHMSENEAEDAFYIDINNDNWVEDLTSYVMATAVTALFCLSCNELL